MNHPFSQVNTHILSPLALEQVARRCLLLKEQAPASENRPARNVARISMKSKGGFKGDDLRRLLNGYLTYVYFGLVPGPILELFMLIEVSQTFWQCLLLCACSVLNDCPAFRFSLTFAERMVMLFQPGLVLHVRNARVWAALLRAVRNGCSGSAPFIMHINDALLHAPLREDAERAWTW